MVKYLETKSSMDLVLSQVQICCPLDRTLVPYKVPPVNLPLAQLCENSNAKLIADRKKDLMQPAELKRRIDLINAKAKAAEESIGAVGNAVGSSAGLAVAAAVAVVIALIIGLAVGTGTHAGSEPKFRTEAQMYWNARTEAMTAKVWAYTFPRDAIWARSRIEASPTVTSLQIRYEQWSSDAINDVFVDLTAVSCLRDPSEVWFWVRAIFFPYECAIRSLDANREATVDAPYTAMAHAWAWRIMHVSRVIEIVSAGRRSLPFLALRLITMLLIDELFAMLGIWVGYGFAGAMHNLTPSFIANVVFLHPTDADKSIFTVTGWFFGRNRHSYLIGSVVTSLKSSIRTCMPLMAKLWTDRLGMYDRAIVFLAIIATAFTRFTVGQHDDLLKFVCGILMAYIVLVQPRQAYLERLQQEREERERFPGVPPRLAAQLSISSDSSSTTGVAIPLLQRMNSQQL